MQIKTVMILGIFLTCFSFSIVAETREEKIARLVEAQGFEDILNEQMKVRIAESERVGKEILNDFLNSINSPERFKKEYNVVYKAYLRKVTKPWTAKKITTVWSRLYGVHFTDKELDGLIAFYTSELAQRETEVIKAAVPEYTRHFQVLAKQVFQEALENFRYELLLIANRAADRAQREDA